MSGDESINRSMPTGMPGTGGTRTPGSATGSLGDSTVEGMAVRNSIKLSSNSEYLDLIEIHSDKDCYVPLLSLGSCGRKHISTPFTLHHELPSSW